MRADALAQRLGIGHRHTADAQHAVALAQAGGGSRATSLHLAHHRLAEGTAQAHALDQFGVHLLRAQFVQAQPHLAGATAGGISHLQLQRLAEHQ